jgi:hypothetical protein
LVGAAAVQRVAQIKEHGTLHPDRCDVAGTPDCGVDDIFVLERAANGLSTNVQNTCAAYFTP